jgi:hypothetical protein
MGSTVMLSAGLKATAAILSIVVGLAACETENTDLPALGAELNATSVSGLSAGAYMAGQFQIAHSQLVMGAGIIAGGPYGCAESVFADTISGPGAAFFNLSKAMNGCMLDALNSWGIPDVSLLAERARKLAQADRIDPVKDVASDRIYLFSGTQDQVVVPAIVKAAAGLYAELGVDTGRIKFITDVAAGHAVVTADKGGACARTAEPYVANCGYDQAGDLLAHIYGPLRPKASQTGGEYLAFDQRRFTQDLEDHGLDSTGVLYIPPECRSAARCRVHVAFHGCNQPRAKAGDAFVRDSGFTAWADGNRLIVLFPQVASSTLNPNACWDWWGYTGRDYHTRRGPQIVAVRRMLDRLAAARERGR